MGELQRGDRLQIMLSSDESKALDEWRFAKHMPSRASAIRELLKRGLAAEGFLLAGLDDCTVEFVKREEPKFLEIKAFLDEKIGR